jgi:hypothetical protein
MTEARQQAKIFLTLTASICATQFASARLGHIGPAELASMSDVIAIIGVTTEPGDGNVTQARVVRYVQNSTEMVENISFVWPKRHFEEIHVIDRPSRGMVLLAFFARRDDGVYVPALVRRQTRDIPLGGRRCFKELERKDVPWTTERLRKLLGSDSLDLEKRGQVIGECLIEGPGIVRQIALEWLIVDRKVDMGKPGEVTDAMAEGLVSCLTDSDAQVRRWAVQATQMAATTRKDLVPYLVDALDDPETREGALYGLSLRTHGIASVPVVDASATSEEKAAAWREWWQQTGSSIPEFKRLSPPDPLARTFMGNPSDLMERLDALVAQGPDVVPEVEPYLYQGGHQARESALWVLSRIPEAATGVLIRCMESEDVFLRSDGLRHAASWLQNADVRDAWVDCFAGEFGGLNAHETAYPVVEGLDFETYQAIAPELVSSILARLGSYDARSTRIMVEVLGRLGEPEDRHVLDALAQLRAAAEMAPPDRWTSSWMTPESAEEHRKNILNAIVFSQASLGDANGRADYSRWVKAEDPKEKLTAAKYLIKLKPSDYATETALVLLTDETPLEPWTPSHMEEEILGRACDFAVRALATWYEGECPAGAIPSVVYSDQILAQVRQWAQVL